MPLPLLVGSGRAVLGGLGSSGVLPISINFASLDDGASFAPLIGATWAISGGKIANTPTESADKLTDGGLENWSSSTNLTSWTETIAGTSTVNQETVDIQQGASAARFDVDSSNSNAAISQSASGIAVGDWLTLRFKSKASTTSKSSTSVLNNQRNASILFVHNTSWVQRVHNAVCVVLAGFTIQLNRTTGTSASLYYDDGSLKVVTKTELYNVVNANVANVIAKANWTVVDGSLAGVITNLDNPANPQNFVVLLSNGSTGTLMLWKVVGGTLTQVVSSGITYIANAPIELRKTASTTYQMYYNNVKIGADQTISDAGIINNTYHGLISAYSGNQCSFFSLAAA